MALTSQSRPGSGEPSGPVHHVFVDFENVQEIDLGSIGEKSVKVTLLLGRMQKRLEVGLVKQLLQRPSGVRLIEMGVSGKNALDLALAYHLGKAAADDPAGCFHIISKDKDFDPLIAHLKSAGIKAFRHDKISVPAILGTAKPAAGPEAKPAVSVPTSRVTASPARPAGVKDRVAVIAESLRKYVATRPKTQKKLLMYIKTRFRGNLQDGVADKIVYLLVDDGVIFIDPKGKVTYPPSEGPPLT
jgi:PIN domain